MCQEVFQMFEKMDRTELETQLALQCAPLLMGIKISNLLIVHKSNRKAVMKLFEKSVISYYMIYEKQDKIMFLLFRRNELISYINTENVKEAMKVFGYNTLKLQIVLKEFSKRYVDYAIEKDIFPHEMGLLLGYPVEDVVGFIENEGKNFLYAGYWKVYSNLSERIQLFNQFNQAKEMVIKLISQGGSILNILDSNESNNYKQHVF